MAQRRIGLAAPARDAARTGSRRVFLICCVVVAGLIGLKIYAVVHRGASGIDQAVVAVTSPAPVALDRAAGGLASLLQVFRLPALLHENLQLKQENVYLQGRLDALQSAAAENQQLHKELALGTVDGCRAVHATVIARPYDLWVENVVLNAGTEAGVAPGCLVANARGLVGKVTQVGAGFSRVELVSSPQFRLAGIAQPGGYEGLVRGVTPGELSLDYVQAMANINTGDKVFTRGGVAVPAKAGVPADPPTPQGLYVGQVVEKSSDQGFLRIKLEPAVDINRLDALTVYVQ
jgi:rod shape-determining protein MreC